MVDCVPTISVVRTVCSVPTVVNLLASVDPGSEFSLPVAAFEKPISVP